MAQPKDLATTGSAGGNNNTVIGQSILISGKLTGDEDLTVQGRAEGELTLTRTLIVEPSGVVKANVAVKNAIISGVVVGNVNATESAELTREGRAGGDIRAPRVSSVDGASFRGRVDMGDVEPGRLPQGRPTIARPQLRPGTAPAKPPLPPATKIAEPAKSKPPVAASAKPQPPPPPAAPAVAAGAKKKVIIKKKH